MPGPLLPTSLAVDITPTLSTSLTIDMSSLLHRLRAMLVNMPPSITVPLQWHQDMPLLWSVHIPPCLRVENPLWMCVTCCARQHPDPGFRLGWVGFGVWGSYGRGFSERVAAPTRLSCLGFSVTGSWLVARSDGEEGGEARGLQAQRDKIMAMLFDN